MTIVSKLRGPLFSSAGQLELIALRAAGEIESLTAENERLRVALEWYAKEARWDDYLQDALDSVYDRNTGSEFGHDPARIAIDALKKRIDL